MSKASPAACFFASFFAPKKEVQDCQGAHSPLIQFHGAPAGRCFIPCGNTPPGREVYPSGPPGQLPSAEGSKGVVCGATHAFCRGMTRIVAQCSHSRARKKKGAKPRHAAAIRSADKSPARLGNGSGARADKMPSKGRTTKRPPNAYRAPHFPNGQSRGFVQSESGRMLFRFLFRAEKGSAGLSRGA